MHYGGNPWPAADRSQPYYARFASGWDKFLANHADGVVDSDDKNGMPHCGPLFVNIGKVGLSSLLLRMMHPIPEKRISIHTAIGDRWLKNVDCCSLEEYTGGHRTTLDAAGSGSCKLAGKLVVKKMHNHLPPTKSKIPMHKFDMGSGD